MLQILVLALFIALVDWWSVYTDRATIESIAKPMVMVALIAAVAAGSPPIAGWFVVIALGLSLVGDIALLANIDRFLVGLGAFFVGHVFFVAGFIASGDWAPALLAIGVACAGIVAVVIGRRIISAATRSTSALQAPVTAYVAVLAVMLATGFATGVAPVIAGAALFASSDAILGWNRFVSPVPHGRLLTHIPYHLGQGLIALWAIGL